MNELSLFSIQKPINFVLSPDLLKMFSFNNVEVISTIPGGRNDQMNVLGHVIDYAMYFVFRCKGAWVSPLRSLSRFTNTQKNENIMCSERMVGVSNSISTENNSNSEIYFDTICYAN